MQGVIVHASGTSTAGAKQSFNRMHSGGIAHALATNVTAATWKTSKLIALLVTHSSNGINAIGRITLL
jgi:hypothetical protein